ncbi:MAG: hypothetical protein GY799_30525, partial [Desulfobulbaceae bacterium]|nr:hypothetical protein [Desulfobulbaceae bacterium]
MPENGNNYEKKQVGESKSKIKWDEMPSGFIGWLLWALPQRMWRWAILVGALVALVVIAMTYLYLFQRESQALQKATLEIDKLRKDYFIALWNRAEVSEWKVALLTHSKLEEIPREYWQKFINHSSVEVQVAAAVHPDIPSFGLDQCFKAKDVRVVLGAIMNQADKRSSKQKIFYQLGDKGDEQLLKFLSRSQDTPVDLLAAIAKYSEVKEAVVKNPQTPPEVLTALAKDPTVDYRVKMAVVNNHEAPPEALAALAKDPTVDYKVKEAAVKNPQTPPEVLAALAKDPTVHYRVKMAVAKNPQAPPEVLAALAKDPTLDSAGK